MKKKPTLLSRLTGVAIGFGFYASCFLAWALLWVAALWLVIAIFSLSQ
jgi:hypothetical protein